MPPNLPNSNTPETVFVHRDYEKIVGETAHIAASSRPAITDMLETPDETDPQAFNFNDLSRKLEELKEDEKIYYTDEDSDDDEEIMGFLKDQDEKTINRDISEIIKTVVTECLGIQPSEFAVRMKKLVSELTEIELITRNDAVIAIRLGGTDNEGK